MSFTELDENYALLLIDFQKGITSNIPTTELQPVVENAQALLKAVREAKKPVIFITYNPFLGNLVTAKCDEPLFPPGTDLAAAESVMQANGWFDLIPDFKPLPGETQLVKPAWNAFYGTSLQTKLSQLGVTQLIFTGITTSSDIEATAIAGLECGYNLVFPLDALGDNEPVGEAEVKVKKLPKIGQNGQTNNLISLIR